MKGIHYDMRLPTIVRRMSGLCGPNAMIMYRTDYPRPAISHPRQVILKTLLGGICGTDMRMLDLDISKFGAAISEAVPHYPMGHELLGRVEEVGDDVGNAAPGDRVIINPVPHCSTRGLDPCEGCRTGSWSQCRCLSGSVDDGEVLHPAGGMTSGGYSEYALAYGGQLYKVPDILSDEEAVLTEPLAVGIHAVSRAYPDDSDTVLVVGSGTIGLMVVAALRETGSSCRIIVSARYGYQADIARRFGADEIVGRMKGREMEEQLTGLTGAHWVRPIMEPSYVFGTGGPDLIIDTIASEDSLTDDLRMIRSGGRLLLVGLDSTRTKKVDWGVLPFKEITVHTAMGYGTDTTPGGTRDSFRRALEIMERRPGHFAPLLTHTFPIDSYRKAFALMRKKRSGNAVKIAFDFR